MPSHHKAAAVSAPRPDVDEGDRAKVGRGRINHLLDHSGGGERALEAATADDRLLPHRGPAGEEEEDHEQGEEQLDQEMRGGRCEQADEGARLLDRHRPSVACLVDLDLVRDAADEPVEILVQVEDRFKRVTNLRDLGRHLRYPVARRNDDRADRKDRDRQEDHDAQSSRRLRRNSAPLEPFEQRHERDGDDQRRRHRHEEFRSGAKRERQGDEDADAADQRERGEQPVALGGDRLGPRARFVFMINGLMLAGPSVHRATIIRHWAARQRNRRIDGREETIRNRDRFD